MENKKIFYSIIAIVLLGFFSFLTILSSNKLKNEKNSTTGNMEGLVLAVSNSDITIMSDDNNIYKIDEVLKDIKPGDVLVIEYAGFLDVLKVSQDIDIVDYRKRAMERDENGVPKSWNDNGIFSDYYIMANNKLQNMTLDEKIGQLLLARYPDSDSLAINDLKKYKLGGFVFFEKDFKDKTKDDVKSMINNLQKNANIPLLTAVDEEGGKVVRVSSNTNLIDETFKSPSELYDLGGFDKIKDDTIQKSKLLNDLGLNVNLAPVVDVSTDSNDYIYERTLKKNSDLTSTFAKTVIAASKNSGVSYVLKHFPGYGNNKDTHTGSSMDTRTYDELLSVDIPPFVEGIKEGAEAVLVSHNTVTSIDNNNPASLSYAVHNLLRDKLDFTGVIITDDISMGALDGISDPVVKAILAGNNIIITTDYEKAFNDIKNAVRNGTIDESIIDNLSFKVLAWKYSKGLMLNQK